MRSRHSSARSVAQVESIDCLLIQREVFLKGLEHKGCIDFALFVELVLELCLCIIVSKPELDPLAADQFFGD